MPLSTVLTISDHPYSNQQTSKTPVGETPSLLATQPYLLAIMFHVRCRNTNSSHECAYLYTYTYTNKHMFIPCIMYIWINWRFVLYIYIYVPNQQRSVFMCKYLYSKGKYISMTTFISMLIPTPKLATTAFLRINAYVCEYTCVCTCSPLPPPHALPESPCVMGPGPSCLLTMGLTMDAQYVSNFSCEGRLTVRLANRSNK